MLKISFKGKVIDESPAPVGKLRYEVELGNDVRAEIVVRAIVDAMRAMTYSEELISRSLRNVADTVDNKEF